MNSQSINSSGKNTDWGKGKWRRVLSCSLLGIVFAFMETGCSNKLVEHPFTVITPVFYQTPGGLQSAVYALYSGMRFNYGPEGTNGITCDGTDEWTYADQTRTGAGGTGDYLTLGNYTLDPTNGAILTPWNRNFSNINLANAVTDFAPNVAMDTSLRNQIVAQARFLRGVYYLLLVEQFGAVPLDLGSGNLHFNQNAFQGFNRLPVDSVLAEDYQAMINDFTYAAQNLQVAKDAGDYKLSQAAAYLMLSRVYMFRAYSAYAQSGDYTAAYTAAMQVIDNQSKYGVSLLPSFASVVASNNNYNQEILWAVERLPGDLNDNEATSGQLGGGKENDATNDFNADYTSVQAPTASSGTKPVSTRTTLYGRPLRRFCPTAWLFNTAFADKINDSRYNATFRTVWLCSTAGGGYNVGDTAFILANTNQIADSMNAIPKKYRVVAPREFYIIGGTTAQNIYPTLSKYSDSLKSIPNDPGGRPYPVCKLSECYLLAAEAAMQNGDLTTAANLINVLRTRAAYRPGLAPSDLSNRVSAMQVTPAQVNLDFILDERTRELCGESLRWPDLALRGKLIARVQADNPDAAANVATKFTLRPVPLSELQAVNNGLTTPGFQNPGY